MGNSLGAAAGGADALLDVLTQKANEAYQRRSLDQADRREGLQQQQIAEAARFHDATLKAAADKVAGDAAAKAAKDAKWGELMADPSTPDAVRKWGAYAQLGANQLRPTDFQTPEQRQAIATAAAQQKIADAVEQHKQIRTFDNQNQPPVRIKAPAALTDDPTLPMGVQRYVVDIARKHGADFNAARQELSDYLNDAGTAEDHPHLSPTKALQALQRASATPAGAQRGIIIPPAGGVAGAPGGPGAGLPTQGGAARLFQHPDRTIRAYPPGGQPGVGASGAGSVQGPAVRPSAGGGISPQVRQQAGDVLRQKLGRAVTDSDLEKFLSSAQNRAALGVR